MEHQNVILYTDEQGHVSLEVSLENETLWLNQAQMAELFGTKQPAISKHLSNIFKSGELDKNSVHSILEYTASDGKTYETSFYNLDAVLSVGYRVNSKNATQFRIWASKILKDYLIKGYALNHQRINAQSLSELTATMELVRKSIENKELSSNEAKGLLDIINNYAKTWALLQGYDAEALHALQGTLQQRFILDYDEAKNAIKALKKDLMAKGDATELFGNEKAGEFQSALLNIYQTFGGVDLLPSIEEKAANLLYYVIKDHAFSDGNKRIGSFLFILFLHKNGIAYKPNGEPKINDNALVSLALLVAASEPSQKELMVKLIVNILGETD
ncbi:virulence protein RhuM/Fic/DOC family protein [Sulfurospirillum sp. MES]|uniref:virulence protein RhuM/Fic/DOC family protein n=1 Tax=Sulfurospirillum sp. MES TaxID=1565314 RepID=UPI000541D9CD|nr:virulence protein RhuM/Fic/DOC family protein [Sulfurospirillum sp. MES]KHG34327.1 MAG: cytochrome C [Sulfurospirillum sp. MES]